ncbi:MAG: hypothetical protein RL328_1404 [Acidobacteriota bacterium]
MLCAATLFGTRTYAQDAPPADEVERLEEKAYVRKFSLGVSLNFTPFNLMGKQSNVEKIEAATPVEIDATADPKSNRVGLGFTAQFALNSRWAIAVAPTYRKFAFHGFLLRYEGIDNSSTFLDERAKYQINEDTTARYLDIPILARHYNKPRTESGSRWFFEVGPQMRMVSRVRMARDTVPPKGERFQDSIPLPYKSNVLGFTAGIGGQFIDDFGIRAIPEVRYTRWMGYPFDSVHGTTRKNQVEIVLTFAF